MSQFTTLEICAGAGGQALGIHLAGFDHVGLVEIDTHACHTLRFNRPEWNVINADLEHFDGRPFRGVDLLAGGLPCPPFSKAGKQLGENDERNLFPSALRLVDEIRPKAILIENVRGLLDPIFADYRNFLKNELRKLGYAAHFHLLNASDFGVPQHRWRVNLVAVRTELSELFTFPMPILVSAPTVGETLGDMMEANGWLGAKDWAKGASRIAPTIVGGSKKHGGPDLGPTRARKSWAEIGVDGSGIANSSPEVDFEGMPKLTVPMVAKIQGFPSSWTIVGKKTNAYRQVGNAFPPPVAQAVAENIRHVIASKPLLRVG